MADFNERDNPASLDAAGEWEDEGGSIEEPTQEPAAAAADADEAAAAAASEEADERDRRRVEANAEHWHGRADPDAAGPRSDGD